LELSDRDQQAVLFTQARSVANYFNASQVFSRRREYNRKAEEVKLI
jgi:hypothetical protein